MSTGVTLYKDLQKLCTSCIDAFFGSITSVEEYFYILFNMTRIRKHIKTLPAVEINISVKFSVRKLSMVAS